MPKKIKTFIFDIDGTISMSGKRVDKTILTEIETLIEKNSNIIFASARPIRDMLPMINDSLSHHCLFIGCNGGMAYQNNNFLFHNLLNNIYVEKIISLLKLRNIPYVLDGTWSFSLSKQPHDFHNYIQSLSCEKVDEEKLINGGVSKILVLNDSILQEISTLFGENVSIHKHKSENFFDITPINNNKFYTINKLINNTPYVAFGNDQNDFLMLDNAEISVFVGNKRDYLNANYYVNFDNIAHFIKKLGSDL
ncbi:hypothetical protein EV694_2055 [Volucribacter psittacicida]|uniref:Hydrolase n=1 Tax=Volucribacter psittacicida TaxID=203482 RepID=A0A4R1FU75_9PAST|nr:HAD-IIB family hydrolase [Volucribacter psittacicida]TCJ94821.1 hypothetical protein EV694_2055 [Volucribacter psittacicida]